MHSTTVNKQEDVGDSSPLRCYDVSTDKELLVFRGTKIHGNVGKYLYQ